MSGVPEELANISAIQQGLGQGENLHFTSQSGRQELDEIVARSSFKTKIHSYSNST